ncbi:MAG: DivIVA domain-containing protein [Clostridia bacterium]|nr:DivIVA domain-containing protein [Clostridia bacterium]MBO5982506.1 DivIVA domain-containing protein [Clostridia bacterium]MBO7221875.1 DivIVA domain-containing protein [Clostridia bacterium]
MKKQNNNQRFKIERKGYNTKEVEEYLVVESERNETVHREQRERIDALINENQQLKKVVDEYKSREDKIAEAIIVARENADKMTAEIKLRYMMELDRLKLFRAKWTGVYEELKERYGFDGDALNVESVAISTKLEIERFLQRDFSLSKGVQDMSAEESFRLESERLSHIPSAVNDLKMKLVEAMKRENVAVSTTD